MRSILLASAALIVSAGLACAQTSSPTPAPTGAPNAPTVTTPGMSPGKTAPATSPTSSVNMTPPSATSSMSSPAPAPTGAPNAPTVTAAGTSPGKTGPNTATTTATVAPVHHPMMHHTYMPQEASAVTYLHIAKTAIRHDDKMTADDALSHAETRLLTRVVAQGAIPADDSPAVMSIENARKALANGNMMEASSDTGMAISQMHEDTSSSMSSTPASSDSTASSGSITVAPTNAMKSPATTGGMGTPASTSDSGAASIGSNSGIGTKPDQAPSAP